MPMILPVVIIFVVWLQYEKRKSERQEHNLSADFWRNEQKANTSRKKSIDHLTYLTISLEDLPIIDTEDSEIKSFQEQITHLSEQKIVNLSNYTNTQLKISYGVGNLDTLSEYDQNYTQLICLLSKWGTYLYKGNYIPEATAVLEFGVRYKTDIRNNYILLAKIYREKNEKNKIDALIHQMEQSNTLLKNSILDELRQIHES